MSDDGRPTTAEEDAELRAYVLRVREGSVPDEEFLAAMLEFYERGLVRRYAEIDRSMPGTREEVAALTAEWLESPEWGLVRDEVERLSGDPEASDFLARTHVSAGVLWVRSGRPRPLNVEAVARVIWNRRNLGGDLYEALEWAQIKGRLEG